MVRRDLRDPHGHHLRLAEPRLEPPSIRAPFGEREHGRARELFRRADAPARRFGDQHQLFAEHGDAREARIGARIGDERGVERAAEDRRDQALRRPRGELHRDLGMAAVVRRERPRQPRGRGALHRSEPQRSARRGIADRLPRLLRQREQPLGIGQEQATGGRELEAVLLAEEERDAQIFLQLAHTHRHVRRHPVEARRGRAHAARRDHRPEDFEVRELHSIVLGSRTTRLQIFIGSKRHRSLASEHRARAEHAARGRRARRAALRPSKEPAMWTDTRFTKLLSLRYPIVQGAFGGGYSTVDLAAAVTNAGGLGSFGAHALSPAQIGATVAALRDRTAGPFVINLWVPLAGERELRFGDDFAEHVARLRPYFRALDLPEPARPATIGQRYEDQVAAALDARPPVLSFIFGVPSAEVIAEARARGIVTFGTAITVDEAIALDRAGVDVIVASGSDAGGHRGAFLAPAEESLVGTFSLIPQVVDAVSAPVVAAGGVADGRGVAAALALGASGVQVGTAFLATHESGAPPVHKAILGQPVSRRTALTRAFSGRLARGIVNRLLTELRPLEPELPPYPLQNWLMSSIRRVGFERGLPEYLALWAGQAAPLARRRSAEECLQALVAETERVVGKLGQNG
ncbi:Enoyl-[acyl-carrier-protein] reductase [Minicystis rosea]|nr:Enoyl-[acyl-carrier-protein] reductase [Minicystis rosea]